MIRFTEWKKEETKTSCDLHDQGIITGVYNISILFSSLNKK